MAAAIDNGDQGRLLSAATLDIDLGGGALRNAGGGLVSGWQGLTLEAGSLDNSAGGTLSSRDGDLDVALSGALNNSGEGAWSARAGYRSPPPAWTTAPRASCPAGPTSN
ncbi:hemagglutinin [Pseudomonas sp. BAY1663]|uniref:hypothetical protein n=1 Tax=Pseudomonas sp. BAY1663 TaxID=1439940 RepID=UPI00042DEB4E|nr:hypothetical protein [Pseudomonas sp. BAY1663]EXF44649.1 hemagglutinin [Pseudomonas sp. BAY1663]